MVMGNKSKYFSPSLASEKLAARIYDRYVIQNLGLKAKTNFSYTRIDLINLLKDIMKDNEFNNGNYPEQDRVRIQFSSFRVPQDDIKEAQKAPSTKIKVN